MIPSSVPGDAWENPTVDVAGREMPLRQLVSSRWEELEVHLIALDLGVTYRDWTDSFVSAWLPRVRVSVGDTSEAGSGLDDRELLAWPLQRSMAATMNTVGAPIAETESVV